MRPAQDLDRTLCFALLSSSQTSAGFSFSPLCGALRSPEAYIVQSCGSATFRNHSSSCTGMTGVSWTTLKGTQTPSPRLYLLILFPLPVPFLVYFSIFLLTPLVGVCVYAALVHIWIHALEGKNPLLPQIYSAFLLCISFFSAHYLTQINLWWARKKRILG